MRCLKSLSVLTFFGLVCVALGKEGDELKAVVVLFRHGDRSPLNSWPNDIYFGNASLWPDGYGQLNNLGKDRHYRLGQWFRERYDGFLPRRYNRNDIYVRSTDVDRTLMSAASNLAGLYPPEGDQVWNSNIPWQAIPIHATPENEDTVLGNSYPCPTHDWLLQTLKDSEEFKKMNEQWEGLFQNISELTGHSSVSLNTFGDLAPTITIYKGFNWSLPAWTETYWPEISALAAINFQLDTYTPDLARLRAGPFNDYLLSHFKNVKNNVLIPAKHVKGPKYQDIVIADTPAQKFLMLSAHDSTIADRTNAMGVFNDASPEFSATVIWELKSNAGNNDDVYVNMYFKNSTHFSQLTLPGCDFDCNLDDYVKLLAPVTLDFDQWTRECNEK